MAIEVKNIVKNFGQGQPDVLKDITLKIPDGAFCTITGRSGSGKSTLLYIISSLDWPTSGDILINGHNLHSMSMEEQHRFRNRSMGFVFQFHHLLPELTALENVLVPAMKANEVKARQGWARELLAEVGLKGKEDRLPARLSGGEQQRVAIARSLVMRPQFIFADEPTGNLDSSNGEAIMELFQRFNKKEGTTVIFVTHDKNYADLANYKISLVDGQLKNSSALS